MEKENLNLVMGVIAKENSEMIESFLGICIMSTANIIEDNSKTIQDTVKAPTFTETRPLRQVFGRTTFLSTNIIDFTYNSKNIS